MSDRPMSGSGNVSWIGASLRRFEDDRLLRGRGRYVDDIVSPECLHVAFVRSPYARAKIDALDVAAAKAATQVIAVFNGADVAELDELPVRPLVEGIRVPRFPILARSAVMAVGEPVVAIIAKTLNAALDAADLVEIDYEPVDPVLEWKNSGISEPLFENIPDNQALHSSWRAGDIEQAFSAADEIVRVRVKHPRLAPSSLEPRATLASWDETAGILTIWVSSQTPHRARTDIANIIGLDEDKVRAIAPDVGGAFGMKASIYPEDVVVAWASVQLRRPVKWTATRGDDLLAATHGRGATTEGEIAVSKEGELLGFRARVVCPLGHWLPFSAAVPAWNAGRILPGPYQIEAIDISIRGVVTNTAPIGIYRGAGRPEAAMLMERVIDEAAYVIGMDPVELRRRNLISPDKMPYETPSGAVFDSGNYSAALERACEAANYERLRAEQRTRRAQGELFGIGVACFVEPSGQGWESATVRLEPNGAITVATGSSDQGQGRSTAYAQIVADALRVHPGSIKVVHGDTASAPKGIGALASRSTPIGGSALLRAAEEVRERARGIAAQKFGACVDEVALDADGFMRVGSQGHALTWEAVVEIAAGGRGSDGSTAAAIESTVVHHADGEAWGYGCYIATVSIDRETGVPRVEHIVCVDDAGVIVNPMLFEGQVTGGIAQGLGEVLMERIVYDDNGQLLTGSLMDYALPRAADMPSVLLKNIETPSPCNPLGAKGVGEAGCIGAPPAILNAAIDALAPFGVRHLDMPLTSEGIWRGMMAANSKE
ncbi:MAG: xanthine dehydrogenase family protein molybdopterin-binding subunit [Alphaproteobacteria bacterium]|nr:xanthine dehydrogenase family protein molybdopterin-binding subunit [Alphaproteobacteria bacterium]